MAIQKPNRNDTKISFDTMSAMYDAAVAFKNGGTSFGASPSYLPDGDSTLVLVKNTTGSVVKQFGVVYLSEPVNLPPAASGGVDNGDATDLVTNDLKRRVVMKGAMPASGSEGRWGVVQQPLGNNAYGQAIVSGLTLAKVNIKDKADKYVEIEAAKTVLQSASDGAGVILWVAGGVGNATNTGEQLAVIKIGGSGGSLPTGQYMGMFYGNTSQNQSGFIFPFCHAYIGS